MLIRTPADVGAVIRDRRRELDLDQATLAKRIGVSRQWLIAVEKGRSRAALGLILRAIDTLGIRLNAATADKPGRRTKSSIDIDAIVSSARKSKR